MVSLTLRPKISGSGARRHINGLSEPEVFDLWVGDDPTATEHAIFSVALRREISLYPLHAPKLPKCLTNARIGRISASKTAVFSRAT
jgi:hypothetical protein